VNRETLTTTAPAPVSRKAARTIPVHISGTMIPDCLCSLVGLEAGILYVRSDRQMSESSAVAVSFDHVQLSGVVAGCQPDEDAWMISVALASCRRRLEERIPHGEESAVGVVERGQTTMRQCTIIDASSFGMGLRLAFPIDTGSRVCIETNSAMVFGEIRYCQSRPDGLFTAGVLIVDVAPDVRTQNQFSIMLNNLRWKLASSIRGRDVPAYRADR
jgi:hypothetical protein